MPTVTVVLDGKEQKFDIDEKGTIYDGVLDKGLDLPHGCLAGSCGACRAEVLEGIEHFSASSKVEEDTLTAIISEYKEKKVKAIDKKNIRLTCRSRISGDVKITPLDK